MKKRNWIKKTHYILMTLYFLGAFLSFFALPISDLKPIMPDDKYFEYYWRDRVSWIGNCLLLLVIVFANSDKKVRLFRTNGALSSI